MMQRGLAAEFLLVIAGGALGCALRYGIQRALASVTIAFPLPTLLANLTGCFLMGVLIFALREGWLSEPWRLACGVGFLGGLTTLSSFCAETWQASESGRYAVVVWYLLATIVGGLVLTAVGFKVAAILSVVTEQ